MQEQQHFLVSARKYRPVNFETVIGQEAVTTTLKNAIKRDQVAHAYLFCGPRGVGKTSCARIFAKNINCENSVDGESCGTCTSCKIFQEGESMAVFELDAASNNSVEDIRELVSQVRIPPQSGKYKVYIIDEVHMLSQAAFNAFLKTLEEPPSYAIFILATTEKHKILPTILSRCQIFDFKRVEVSDITYHLENICKQENIEYERECLFLIAQKCEGCIRDALSLLDKIISFSSGKITLQQIQEHLNILDEGILLQLIEYMLVQNITDSLLQFNNIYRKGFEGDIIVEGLINCFRNLLICKDEKLIALLEVNELYKPKYKEIAENCGIDFIISSMNILNENILQYKSANNKQLNIEILLIKLNYLKQTLQLVGEDESVKKK
ncbi:MAG: DNA polymerase III subunit gamma/tau, partial [Chitinophagaceae bacterium]